MITTIQVHENTKNQLEKFKEDNKETYEDVILNLMETVEKNKRNNKKLLIEECKEMAKDNLQITKELENIDNNLD